ncbi:MAG TPA: hypothetical protein VGJ44_14255, partial [Kribbellaceae bacterium]
MALERRRTRPRLATPIRLLLASLLLTAAGAAPAVASAPSNGSSFEESAFPRKDPQLADALGPRGLLADVVVIGVPGLRWYDVEASPELSALVGDANAGSMSVKTSGSQTCPIDAWLTISAGTRAWGTAKGQPCPDLPAVRDNRVEGWSSYLDLQANHHTDAQPGRMGALGNRLCGFGPGAALAVARPDGVVAAQSDAPDGRAVPDGARTQLWWPRFDAELLASCNDAVVDAGALPLRDGRPEARERVAQLVEQARSRGRWVVLAGISEETAGAHRETMVALQLPPDDGARWLTSATTRRPGLVQLTDLTATLLSDSAPDAPLDGSEIHSTGDVHTDTAAVIRDRLDTNTRFTTPPPVLIAVGLTVLAVQLLALAWYVLRRTRPSRRTFIATMLVQGGFFSAVFLSTLTGWWRWPAPGLALYGLTLAISAVVGLASYLVLKCRAVLGVVAASYVVLLVDGVLGTPLQVGSMFADGPIVGGRYFGFGNSTFAVFAVGTLVTAAAVGARVRRRSPGAGALGVLAVGGAGVVVDGVPGWGTDFGGVIALTPAVLYLAWHTWRGRVSWRAVLGLGLTGFVAVAALAYADYRRPPADRTHFGTFVARLLDGDVSNVIVRKLTMSFAYLN